jgi:D-3-phosphoglycerate dehydrogenase
LKGILDRTMDGVNMVNAPYLAKERDIEVKESKSNEIHDYTSTIRVQVKTKTGGRDITGSVFGKGDPRIVKFDDFYFEAVFSKYMLVMNNKDVPGVIGNIGNVLGKNGINVAGFHLGRVAEKDRAMAVINVDTPPNNETLRALRETPNIIEVNSVVL